MTLLRWLAALLWLGMTCVLLLMPGEEAVVENTHDFFGGTDVTDWIGHVILLGVWAGLLTWALERHLPADAALRLALWTAILVGVVLEGAQLFIAGRGASWFDAVGNALGPILWAGWRQSRIRHHAPQNR